MALHSPEDVASAWQQAWNASDADGLAALFAEDADFVNVVGLWWHDRERIRIAHEYGLRVIFPGSRITMRTPRVRRLGDASAVVQCRWRITGQVTPNGAAAGPREGIFTFVLEHRADGWIVVTAHNTDIVEHAETHVSTDAGRSSADYRSSVDHRSNVDHRSSADHRSSVGRRTVTGPSDGR